MAGQTLKPGQPVGRPEGVGSVATGTDWNEWVWDGLNWIPRPKPPEPEPEPLNDTEYRNSKWSDEDA